MFQNKTDTLLFFSIGILIAEKITDHHHAYNRRSEIIHMNLITCLNITLLNKIWRSISNKFSGISIFTCRIRDIGRSIVLAIKKNRNTFIYNSLSNKFLKYETEWNVLKIR